MEQRYQEANKVTIQSIIWNLILTIIKIMAGVIGKSNAMVADGYSFSIRYNKFSRCFNRKLYYQQHLKIKNITMDMKKLKHWYHFYYLCY